MAILGLATRLCYPTPLNSVVLGIRTFFLARIEGMGMAMMMTPEQEEEMNLSIRKRERFERFLFYCTDVCFGFFIMPFLYFIARTTVYIVSNPTNLTDGIAIIYIALITGMFYLLKRDTVVVIETKRKNILMMILGLTIFILALYKFSPDYFLFFEHFLCFTK